MPGADASKNAMCSSMCLAPILGTPAPQSQLVKISHQSLEAVGSFVKQLHWQVVEQLCDFRRIDRFGLFTYVHSIELG